VLEIISFPHTLNRSQIDVKNPALASEKNGVGLEACAETLAKGFSDSPPHGLCVPGGVSVNSGLLAAEKEAFRDIEAQATQAHFDRLRAGRIEAAETSSLHLDILRDLKRVNTHLVAAAAYPVLEGKGELLPNRLRQAGADGEE